MSTAAFTNGVLDQSLASQDFTVPAYLNGETPKAAIIYFFEPYAAGVNWNGTLDDGGAYGGMGLVDDSGNQCSTFFRNQDGSASASRSHDNLHAVVTSRENSTSIEKSYSATLIPNGIRLSKVTNVNNFDLLVSVHFIAGSDVQAKVMTAQDGAGPIQNIGFEPNALVAISNNLATIDGGGYGAAVHTHHVVGFCTDVTNPTYDRQYSHGTAQRSDTNEAFGYVSLNYFMVGLNTSADNIAFGLSHTAFSAANGGEHQYTGSANSYWFPLYLRFENEDVGTWAVNASVSTGVSSYANLSFDPQNVLGVGNETNNLMLNTALKVNSVSGKYLFSVHQDGSTSMAWRQTDTLSNGESSRAVSDSIRVLNFDGTGSFEGDAALITNGWELDYSAPSSVGPFILYFAWGSESLGNVKYGALDIDGIKYGASDVSKIYYGADEL